VGAIRVTYDLLLKGGHVLDPGQRLDATLDIAVKDGKIARIAADIPATEAARVLELRGAGRRVVPGLIDLHTHVASGATTAGVGMGMCDPDAIGVHSGVTTVADCGSVGIASLGVFPAHILPVRTVKAGEEFSPGWGTHPWGWLPASASVG
jgi:dihydroorotase